MCVRIFSITGCQGAEALAWSRHKRSSGPFDSGTTCMIAAMILGSPPQFGQCAVSISKTRLSRLGGPGAYATGRIGATGSRQRMSLKGRRQTIGDLNGSPSNDHRCGAPQAEARPQYQRTA